MKLSLDEVMEKYKISEEQIKKIQETIIEIMLSEKSPVKRPKAIFNIGPPGSGKTGLNGYAVKQFENGNIIVINNDEFKPFHPKADEIARLYPEYYTKVTNEASKVWTDELMNKALNEGYNVLYEGTGRKIKIFEKMISKMQECGYEIIVRAMAVNELSCLMSILERYKYQVKQKGWGRLISTDTFYKAYDNEMLSTIDIFEDLDEISRVEVYMRGETPSQPKKIYSSENKQFPSARQAVIYGRKKDMENAREYFNTSFNMEELNTCETLEEKDILKKIYGLYNNVKQIDN